MKRKFLAKTKPEVGTSTKAQANPAKGRKAKQEQVEATSQDQPIEDMIDLIQTIPAFSYVFLGSGGACALGPTLASAVELVECMGIGIDYHRPYPECLSEKELAEAKRQRKEIIKEVKDQVAELKCSDESFVLVWNAFGDTKPRLDHSGDYSYDQIAEELADYLKTEIWSSINP